MEMSVNVFNVQRFSVHDGPGIRTLAFFKGCSLSCDWCSNPEGIQFEKEIRQTPNICMGCGHCLKCPVDAVSKGDSGILIDRDKCDKCGYCVEHCPTKSLAWWGKEYTVTELFELIKRDSYFFNTSGGGITLGGGDPLLQSEQAAALLKMCREKGIDTAIETAGNYPWSNLENAVPYCNTIHFDIKGWNPETHRLRTGADKERILANLRKLDAWIAAASEKPRLIVRIPLLPGYNFTLEEFEELAAFLQTLKSMERVEVLPFHNLGGYKYKLLGRTYHLEDLLNTKDEEVMPYYAVLDRHQLPVSLVTI